MRSRGGLAVYAQVFRANRALIAASAATAVAWQLVALAVPVLLGWVVAKGLERSDAAVVWAGAAAVLGLAALEAVFDGWRHHAENHASALASAMLRQRLVETVLSRSGTVADPGDLVARSTNDVAEVATVVDSLGWTLAYAAAIPVATAALVVTDPWLGATALATSLVSLAVVGSSSAVWERRSEHLQEAVAASFRYVQESLAGIETLHGLGAVPRAQVLYGDASREIGRRARRFARLWLWYEPGLRFATALAVAGVLCVGGRAVQAGTLSMGGLVAAVGLSLYLVTPVTVVGQQFLAARAALASANRVAAALVAADPAEYGDGPVTVHDGHGRLVLEARAGDVVLLRGAEAGHLGRLLAGQPTAGGSYAIRGGGLPALRLDATPLLFAGTLEANLRLARPEATAPELHSALVDADVAEFLPADEGLAVDLGNRGSRLSGGQRQRVALARALLSRPAVLVVDQALSGLEPSRQERLLRRLVDLAEKQVLVLLTDHPAAPALATVRVSVGG